MQQQVQLAAHRLQQLPPHRRGTGPEGLACLPPLEPIRFLLLRAPWVMRITSKGQATIPQVIREQCVQLPHTQVRFLVEGGRMLIEKEPAQGSPAAKACNSCVGPACALASAPMSCSPSAAVKSSPDGVRGFQCDP